MANGITRAEFGKGPNGEPSGSPIVQDVYTTRTSTIVARTRQRDVSWNYVVHLRQEQYADDTLSNGRVIWRVPVNRLNPQYVAVAQVAILESVLKAEIEAATDASSVSALSPVPTSRTPLTKLTVVEHEDREDRKVLYSCPYMPERRVDQSDDNPSIDRPDAIVNDAIRIGEVLFAATVPLPTDEQGMIAGRTGDFLTYTQDDMLRFLSDEGGAPGDDGPTTIDQSVVTAYTIGGTPVIVEGVRDNQDREIFVARAILFCTDPDMIAAIEASEAKTPGATTASKGHVLAA